MADTSLDAVFGTKSVAGVGRSSALKTSLGDQATASAISGYTGAASRVTGAIFGGITAGYRSAAVEQAGLAERERREFNATLLNMQADDVMEAQEDQAADYMLKVGRVGGAQRSGFASQGVSVNSSVAKRLAAETRGTARQNVARLMNKARLEASGIRTQASFQQMAGRGIAAEAEGRGSAIAAAGAVRGFSAAAAGAYSALDTAGVFTDDAQSINAYRRKTR